MKKILAFVLALTMISTLFLFASCDQKPEETPSGTDESGATLAGKTPEAVYNAAKETLKNMTAYEIYATQSYETEFAGEPIISSNTTEYKLSGNTAYANNINSQGDSEEQWFVENVLYYSGADNKEKIEMDLDTFMNTYSLDPTTILLSLKSEEFAGKKFEKIDDVYFLEFSLTPEKFSEYVGGTITENAAYKIGFGETGNIVSVEMTTLGNASDGTQITMKTLFEIKNIGKAVAITAPSDASDYRVAPALSSLDMSTLDSIDGLSVSEEATDYVMLDVEGYGKIVIRLYDEVAPKTVANFKKLVSDSFYDGLIFHRVIKDFMIQGGGYDAENNYKETDNIKGEFAMNGFSNNLLHSRGVVSMARTDDPNSASGQFFIMHADATHLDGSYAAFGFVVYGMDTVDAIATVETDSNDAPTTTVVINSAQFVKIS